MDAALAFDMQREAQIAVDEDMRMTDERLTAILALWLPEATDEEIETIVRRVL